LIELLDGASLPFDEGLTDAEVLQAETKYDPHFPHDLREFLQTVLPRGYPLYPDWRAGEEEWIRGMLRSPLDGILIDVERLSVMIFGFQSGVPGLWVSRHELEAD
jgi:hypothetical protein